jgi:hypothetical protein
MAPFCVLFARNNTKKDFRPSHTKEKFPVRYFYVFKFFPFFPKEEGEEFKKKKNTLDET